MLPGCEVFLTSFVDLNSCRFPGGRIPWTTIDAYGQKLGYTGCDLGEFIEIIRRVDEGYLEMVSKNE